MYWTKQRGGENSTDKPLLQNHLLNNALFFNTDIVCADKNRDGKDDFSDLNYFF